MKERTRPPSQVLTNSVEAEQTRVMLVMMLALKSYYTFFPGSMEPPHLARSRQSMDIYWMQRRMNASDMTKPYAKVWLMQNQMAYPLLSKNLI